MTAALRYLLLRSFINGIVSRLKRLRQPKYIAGALIGGAYFYFYIYKFLFHGISNGSAAPFPPEVRAGIGAAMLLLATVLLSWVRPSSRAAIHFTEAEIAFLFPAPISRRRLVIHKLLKSQFTLLFLSAFMTLLTGRFKLGVAAWYAMGGWWIILNTLNMHRIGASFALHRLADSGASGWVRRILMLLVLAGVAVLGWYVWRALPPFPAARGNNNLFGLSPEYLASVLNSGPLPAVLAPFKLVLAPYLAATLPAFLAALPVALGIMAAHFLWIIAADVAFEESAIAASARRAKVIAAFREGRLRPSAKSGKARTPVWRLRMRGFAPFAFIWKTLIRFGGRRAMLLWLILFIALAALANFLRTHAGPGASGKMIALIIVTGAGCYITVLVSLVMVGQSASAQLRKGMVSMDLLKTYPLPGWKLALGELAGPVLLGTALQWAAIGTGTLLISGFAASSAGGMQILALSASALVVLLPMFNLSMSILPSAAALLFPGWFKPQDVTSGGLENTGLRLMIGVMQLLAMAGAMLPVVLFGGCAWLLSGNFGLDLAWRIICATGTGAFIFAMEAALGIAWLGGLYDRYDGSSE